MISLKNTSCRFSWARYLHWHLPVIGRSAARASAAFVIISSIPGTL